MGTLHLVRHGQASLGDADYDRLSPLGQRQCEQLGRHLRDRGLAFSAVLRGSLRRHRESCAALAAGFGPLPAAVEHAALDEYDAQALMAAVHDGPLVPPQSAEAAREHFRVLRHGLLAWMHGRSAPEGMPPFDRFRAGVASVLEHVSAAHDGHVLLVSSGGPISVAVGLVLGLAPEAIVELNMGLRNSSVTEFTFTPRQHRLVGFNGIGHLEHAEHAAWVTRA